MFDLFKKKYKRNIIVERMKALSSRLWFIQMVGSDPRVEVVTRFIKGDSTGRSEQYKIMTLDTIFGERKIAINDSSLYYGLSDLIKENDFDENYWSLDFKSLFSIRIRDENVYVEFPSGLKMTKEEVDLAILEFEKAIDEKYKSIINGQKEHEELVKYLIEGC